MFEAKSFPLKVNFGCLNAVIGQMVIWGKESNPSASFLYLKPLKKMSEIYFNSFRRSLYSLLMYIAVFLNLFCLAAPLISYFNIWRPP